MPIKYLTIYNCCVEKCNELEIRFDFDNNTHLQHPQSMDDVYKNLVFHSQNRSQGCAINFFKEPQRADSIWNIIAQYAFNFENDYDYINLFFQLKDDPDVANLLRLEGGKDIQYIELAKTCQCIKKYLNNYENLESFVNAHRFTSDARRNWGIIKTVARSIYNVGTELIPDFFKEQDCISGREYLVKADIHVKRFFSNLFNSSLSDKQVYEKLLELYNESDQNTKQNIPPYKVDKLIYLIGERYGNPNDSKRFAQWVLERCNQED